MNKVGVWNVWGINIPAKHSTINEVVASNNFSIVVLLETKVKKEQASNIMASCGLRM